MLTNLVKVEQSHSVSFADYVRVREYHGHKIIKMQTGDPDFATHPRIVQAAHEALIDGQTKYCESRGLLSLRNAIAKKLAENNGINASSAENILVTHGAVHGIGIAIRALINPGDECIIYEPFWRSYQMNVILAGGIPVIVKASPKKGFQLESKKILAEITTRTKAIVINTPNNPSGAVYDRNELVNLASEAAARGIFIISDEVYESLVFDSNRHYSVASDPKVFDWTISAFSFSKTYAMTGWRMGYLVASKLVIDEMLKLSQFSVTSLSPFSQLAALEALNNQAVGDYAKEMCLEYEKRRNKISATISGTWLEQTMTCPEGAFYALIDTSRFGMPSLELAKKIVDFAGVAFTPGIAFGDGMDGYLRMCFATSDENIDVAIDALIKAERKLAVIPPIAPVNFVHNHFPAD